MLNKIKFWYKLMWLSFTFRLSNICYIIIFVEYWLVRNLEVYFSSSPSSTVTFDIEHPNPFTNHGRFNRERFGAERERIGNRNLGFTNRSRCPIVVKLRNTHFALSTTDEITDGNWQYRRTPGKGVKGRGPQDVYVRETEHATKNV